MKWKPAVILIVAIIFMNTILTFAGQAQSIQEGMKPYIPTRLEWLAVELNASNRVDMYELEGYLLSFIPLERENTILIFVRYTSKTNREAMNIGIETARKVVEMDAKSRGWNSWLKVREDISLQKSTKPRPLR
jgi:hypothetical protein